MKKQNLNSLVSALNQKSSNEAVEAAAKKVKAEETKTLQVEMDKKIHTAFKAKAAANDTSMTMLVQKWIAEYLSKAD